MNARIVCYPHQHVTLKERPGEFYPTAGEADLIAAMHNPQRVAKADAVCWQPTTYNAHDAREHEAQRQRGSFPWVVLDCDDGDIDPAWLPWAIRGALGPCRPHVYSTASSCIDGNGYRSRVIVPLAAAVSGDEYAATMGAIIHAVAAFTETHGKLIKLDPCTKRAGQFFFGPNHNGTHYVALVAEGPDLVLSDAIKADVAHYLEMYLKFLADREARANMPDDGKWISRVNRDLDPMKLMQDAGFEYRHSSKGRTHWHHQMQTTNSAATYLYQKDDGSYGWHTRSATLANSGLGVKDAHEETATGDLWALYRWAFAGNDNDAAIDHYNATTQFGYRPEINNSLETGIYNATSYLRFIEAHGRELADASWAYQCAAAQQQLADNDAAMAEALAAPVIEVPVDMVTAYDDDDLEPELYTGDPLTDPEFEALLSSNMLPAKAPPGLVGDVYRFARHNTVTAALPEMLIPMSLSFVSTMALNAYYVERTGINNAYVVVADTAIGKSSSFGPFRELARYVSAENLPQDLLNPPTEGPAVDHQDPNHIKPKPGLNFIRGWPSHGNSYHKRLGKFATLLSFVDEFGTKLIEANNAGGGIAQTVVNFITEVITASGPTNALMAKDYTDDNKSVAEVYNPSFNFLGLMVPEQYERVFTKDSAASGAANRRLVFEEKKRNGLPVASNTHATPPSPQLVASIAQLTNHAYNVRSTPVPVTVDNLDTAMYMSNFARYVNYQNARRDREPEIRNMWARIYVHCLKVAATVAVGTNHVAPKITLDIFKWAQELVAYSHGRVLWRLEQGAYGGNPGKDYDVAKQCILTYIGLSPSARRSHGNAGGTLLDPACVNIFRVNNIVALMQRRGVWDERTSKSARVGETAAMLQHMADDELLEEVSDAQMSILKLKSTSRVVGNKVYMAKPVLLGK